MKTEYTLHTPEGEKVGSVKVHPVTGRHLVHTLWVHPNHRGQGLSCQLLQQVANDADREGVVLDSKPLGVQDVNDEARDRQLYTGEGHVPRLEGDGVRALHRGMGFAPIGAEPAVGEDFRTWRRQPVSMSHSASAIAEGPRNPGLARHREAAALEDDYTMRHRPIGNEADAIHREDGNAGAFAREPGNWSVDTSKRATYLPPNPTPEQLNLWQHRVAGLQSWVAVAQAQGNPEAPVKIYRAVPHGIDRINPEDWVALSPMYAKLHSESSQCPECGRPFQILQAEVPAKHVRFDSASEYGFYGPEPVVSTGRVMRKHPRPEPGWLSDDEAAAWDQRPDVIKRRSANLQTVHEPWATIDGFKLSPRMEAFQTSHPMRRAAELGQMDQSHPHYSYYEEVHRAQTQKDGERAFYGYPSPYRRGAQPLDDYNFAHTASAIPELAVRDYEGEVGNRDHITRDESGMVPIEWVQHLCGARGEVPGEHRNYQGQDWEDFKSALAGEPSDSGIHDPIFITVDHGEQPVVNEGNHRLTGYGQIGATHVPVHVRYFGHAEQQGGLGDRAGMQHEAAADWLQGETMDSIGETLRNRHPDIDFDVYPAPGKTHLKLQLIRVPDNLQNQGRGTAAMNDLVAAADHLGTQVSLTPQSPTGSRNKTKLDRFYRSFGFRPNKGRNKDYTVWESYRRMPRQASANSDRKKIDDLIDQWHDAKPGSEAASMQLHEWLGMTPEQYEQHVIQGKKMPKKEAAVDESGIKAAGIAVIAMDTGRVLMQQRALNPITCPCGQGVTWDEQSGWQHDDGSTDHDQDEFYGQSVDDLLDQGHHETCPECDGAGQDEDGHECTPCDGSGVDPDESLLKTAMPRDEDYLNDLSFEFSPNVPVWGGSEREHQLAAYDYDGAEHGHVFWRPENGVIKHIETVGGPDDLHRGLGTELLRRAKQISRKNGYPELRHSPVLTGDGKDFVANLGDERGGLVLQREGSVDFDPNEGTWEFPGGKLDPGELPLDAAKREFREEVGQELPPGVFVGAWLSPGGLVVAAGGPGSGSFGPRPGSPQELLPVEGESPLEAMDRLGQVDTSGWTHGYRKALYNLYQQHSSSLPHRHPRWAEDHPLLEAGRKHNAPRTRADDYAKIITPLVERVQKGYDIGPHSTKIAVKQSPFGDQMDFHSLGWHQTDPDLTNRYEKSNGNFRHQADYIDDEDSPTGYSWRLNSFAGGDMISGDDDWGDSTHVSVPELNAKAKDREREWYAQGLDKDKFIPPMSKPRPIMFPSEDDRRDWRSPDEIMRKSEPWVAEDMNPNHHLHPMQRLNARKAPVYKGFIYLIQNERDIDLTSREHANPDDPDGDMTEQSAWWDIEHARKNPALRKEVKGAPWAEFELWSDKSVRSSREVTAMVVKLSAKAQKCEYCKAPSTKKIIHSEGMAYIPVCDKHLSKGKDAAAACVPYGDPDPGNIDRIDKLADIREDLDDDYEPEDYPLQPLDELDYYQNAETNPLVTERSDELFGYPQPMPQSQVSMSKGPNCATCYDFGHNVAWQPHSKVVQQLGLPPHDYVDIRKTSAFSEMLVPGSDGSFTHHVLVPHSPGFNNLYTRTYPSREAYQEWQKNPTLSEYGRPSLQLVRPPQLTEEEQEEDKLPVQPVQEAEADDDPLAQVRARLKEVRGLPKDHPDKIQAKREYQQAFHKQYTRPNPQDHAATGKRTRQGWKDWEADNPGQLHPGHAADIERKRRARRVNGPRELVSPDQLPPPGRGGRHYASEDPYEQALSGDESKLPNPEDGLPGKEDRVKPGDNGNWWEYDRRTAKIQNPIELVERGLPQAEASSNRPWWGYAD